MIKIPADKSILTIAIILIFYRSFGGESNLIGGNTPNKDLRNDSLNFSNISSFGIKKAGTFQSNESDNKTNDLKYGNASSQISRILSSDAQQKMLAIRKTLLETQISQILNKAFKNSLILEPDECKTLYLNLPFNIQNPPDTELIFSLGPDNRSTLFNFSLQNKFEACPTPSVLIMKFNGEKFGGYAAEPWNAKSVK